jgi:hypothetical protein
MLYYKVSNNGNSNILSKNVLFWNWKRNRNSKTNQNENEKIKWKLVVGWHISIQMANGVNLVETSPVIGPGIPTPRPLRPVLRPRKVETNHGGFGTFLKSAKTSTIKCFFATLNITTFNLKCLFYQNNTSCLAFLCRLLLCWMSWLKKVLTSKRHQNFHRKRLRCGRSDAVDAGHVDGVVANESVLTAPADGLDDGSDGTLK